MPPQDPKTPALIFPEMAQAWPKRLNNFIDTKYGCVGCEGQFKVTIKTQDGTKKSKSWAIGLFMWGSGDSASACEVFCVKCPSCGQPAQLVVLSKRQLLSELLKGAPMESNYANKPQTAQTLPPKPPAAPQGKFQIQRKPIEIKK